jgi:hypothetical protein
MEKTTEIGNVRGSIILLEKHRGCDCSYCWPGRLKVGLNWPECRAWNAWVVLHWRWRGSRWYLRFTRGRIFGEGYPR